MLAILLKGLAERPHDPLPFSGELNVAEGRILVIRLLRCDGKAAPRMDETSPKQRH
jgi:hypothetical protein